MDSKELDTTIRTIVEKWKTSLTDKSKSAVSGNFDRLFMRLAKLDIPFDTARSTADKAIDIHFPRPSVIKGVWRKAKTNFPGDIKEFEESWKEMISEKGLESFHAFFSEDTEDEPAMVGTMSAQEYIKQRKYANSFPTFDWTTARDQISKNQEGFEDLVGDIDLNDRDIDE